MIRHDKNTPVHTFFDLGINDHHVILFVQFVGKEVRIINMLKGADKSIKDHWIPELKRLQVENGYVFGGHWLPHDSAQRDKWSGRSIYDEVKGVLPDTYKLPRPSSKLESIQKARTMFDNTWIDKANCSDLYDDLSNYKRKWDSANNVWSNEPVHNEASHSSDAFQYVAYYKAPVLVDVDEFYSNRHR
jgi:phage terminase large subunit